MFATIVQLWFLAFLLAAIAWWRARGEDRGKAGKLLGRLLGAGAFLMLWSALDALPWHGLPAKISIVTGGVMVLGWYLRIRVLPAMEIWWRQFLAPHAMVHEEDQRDVSRLRWPRVDYDYADAIKPYV